MPPVHPDTEPMNADDLLQLEQVLSTVQGWDKIKPTLGCQEHFFGLIGTAVLLRKPDGSFWPMVVTNVPNAPTECEMEGGEIEESEEEESEEEDDSQDEEASKWLLFVQTMIDNLAPCFQYEKVTRYFARSVELHEFIAPDLAEAFNGYKLVVLPIRKSGKRLVQGLVILYVPEFSEYLVEDDLPMLERLWRVFAFSLKLT